MRQLTVLGVLSFVLMACSGSGSGIPTSKVVLPTPQNVSMDYVYGTVGLGCFLDQAQAIGFSEPDGFRILCFDSNGTITELMNSTHSYVKNMLATGLNTVCVEYVANQTRSDYTICFGNTVGGYTTPPQNFMTDMINNGATFDQPVTSWGPWPTLGLTDQSASNACTLLASIYDCRNIVPNTITFTLIYGLN